MYYVRFISKVLLPYSYTVYRLYNDDDCTTVSAVQAFQQDTCVDLTDAFNGNMNGQQRSYSISLPYVYAYTYTKCSPQSYTKYTISSGQCSYPYGYITGTTELSQSWASFSTSIAAPTFQATPTVSATPTLLPITIAPSTAAPTPIPIAPTKAPSAIPSTFPTSSVRGNASFVVQQV